VCISHTVPLSAAAGLERFRFAVVVGAGAATALTGLIGFGLAHAFVIVPIWSRLLSGVPIALLAGVVLAGAFDRVACLTGPGLCPGRRRGRSRPSMNSGRPEPVEGRSPLTSSADRLCTPGVWRSLADGAGFGAIMFTTLLPPTVLAAALRAAGVRDGESNLVAAGAVVLALLAGSCAGWLLTHRRDGALVCSAAALALLLASAGPLPVAQSLRGFQLSLALAPVCVAAGAVLALVRACLADRREP
jgi:hypothetical protein